MRKPQLFLLHFAGGNCYSFQFMALYLKEFEVIPLELPGRGRRMGEPLLYDFDQAAQDIFNQLVQRLNPFPCFIYGHSMGTYLALRVANMLERIGQAPAYVIVSGNAGPGMHDPKNRYEMPHDAFVEELRNIGGVPEELLENKELFNFFEPVLRADFQVAEKNDLTGEPPVRSPLYAMMGSSEDHVQSITNWKKFTQSRFDYSILEGGHFFIHKHPRKIASIIADCYHRSSH
jgi:external thioesterase TEII